MISITKIVDNIYKATLDDKSIFIVVAIQAEAHGNPGLAEINRLLKLLELHVDISDTAETSIDYISKSIDASGIVRKHLGITPDGSVIGFLCKTQSVVNQTVKCIQAYDGAVSI